MMQIDAQVTPNMTEEQINILREQSGLNQPFYSSVCCMVKLDDRNDKKTYFVEISML